MTMIPTDSALLQSPLAAGDDSTASDAGPASTSLNSSGKQTRSSVACMHCRRSKLRCDYAERSKLGETSCSRCHRLQRNCEAIPGHKGRKLGSKNKPKAKGDREPAMTIDPLLNDTGLGMSFDATFPPFSQPPLPTKSVASDERMRSATNSQNPLSLLAEASHGAQTPLFGTFSLPAQPSPHLIIREDTPMMGLRVKREVLQEGLKTIMSMPGDGLTGQPRDYFANQQTDHRDLGETLDPCDIGLLDEADLPRLFAAFYDDAHQCGPTLDPALHTPAYVRSHSALLLTTIALLAAQSTPGEALLTKRLHRHALFLRKEIYLRNYRSIEIIQALNLMAIWPRTGASSADDQSGLALAQSTAIALELGLERNVEAKKGPSGMTLESDVEAQRHQRNRERTAITLYIWDRAFAAATGRSWSLPDSFLLPTLEGWERHPLALQTDSLLVYHALLRFESCAIRNVIRAEQVANADLSKLPALVVDMVQARLGGWLVKWQSIRNSGQFTTRHNAYLTLIYNTTRVWTLALALSYATLPTDGSGEALVAALQAAALEACELVVLHSDELITVPANVCVLVVYSTLLALKLQQAHGASNTLAPLLGLMAQVAHFFQRSGSSPPHRAGPNAIYGTHLLQVLRAAATVAPTPPNGLADGGQQTLLMGGDALMTGDGLGMDAWPQLDWLHGCWPADVVDALSFAMQG